MTRGPDTRGCMLDLGVYSNEIFRFSTTALQWEELDAALVSGSPPSARSSHAMAAVGSDIFVFGGSTDQGEEARCACWPPSGCMSEIAPTIAPRAAAVCARGRMISSGGTVLLAAPGSGGDTRGGTAALSWHRVSQRAHPDEHVHNVAHREPRGAPGVPCRG